MRGELILAFSCLIFFGQAWLEAVPVVTNVTAAQRPGTKLVDIYFDVTSDAPPVNVRVAVSDNAGMSYTVSASSFSGDVGKLTATGTGKHVVWDAGSDYNTKIGRAMRFKVFANDALAPKGFVEIPAGSFQMGDSMREGLGFEIPVHTVNLSAFHIEKTPVTKAQWDTVYAWALANGYSFDHAGVGKAADHPVVLVSWFDVIKWCNARSEMEGLPPCYTTGTRGEVYRSGTASVIMCDWNSDSYRLPSEAEWEKAARGGLVGKRFPWGDTISHENANYCSFAGFSYDVSPTRGSHPMFPNYSSSPVGYFQPNGYGLYDMAGNAAQWVWDWQSFYGMDEVTDPVGPVFSSGPYVRGIRGGSFVYYSDYARVSYRRGYDPSGTLADVGFRCARR